MEKINEYDLLRCFMQFLSRYCKIFNVFCRVALRGFRTVCMVISVFCFFFCFIPFNFFIGKKKLKNFVLVFGFFCEFWFCFFGTDNINLSELTKAAITLTQLSRRNSIRVGVHAPSQVLWKLKKSRSRHTGIAKVDKGKNECYGGWKRIE